MNALTPDAVDYLRDALEYGQNVNTGSGAPNAGMPQVLQTQKAREAYACLEQVFQTIESGSNVTGRTDMGIALTCHGGIPVLRIPTVQFAGEQAKRAILRLKALMEHCPGAGHLIIDMRGNGGGNSKVLLEGVLPFPVPEPMEVSAVSVSLCGPLTRFLRGWNPEELQHAPDGAPESSLAEELRQRFSVVVAKSVTLSPGEKRFMGKTWALVDGWVYSAAEDFVILCKTAKLATLVGARTQGGGGLSSQPVVFSLPNSGLVVFLEDVAHIGDDGACSSLVGTTPDIAAEGEALEVCLKRIAEEEKSAP